MGDKQHRYRRVPRSTKMTKLCIIGLLMAVVAISCSADVSAEYDSITPEPIFAEEVPEELVAIGDNSDESWGYIRKRIKKRIKKFVKKSKKRFSRSKLHRYFKKYLRKYRKNRKKLKNYLKKRKRRRL